MSNWTIVATEESVTVTHADGRVMEFTHSDYSDLYGQAVNTWRDVYNYRRLPEIRERVAQGMAFLDEYYPDHVQRVNLERLDIHSGALCPLGQAYSQERALRDGFSSPFWAAEAAHPHILMFGFGFIANQDGDMLNILWREAYEARRNG